MAEINAVDYLNSKLLSKSNVIYSRVREECHWPYDSKHNRPSEPICSEHGKDVEGAPQVVNSRVVKVTDLVFDRTQITSLPETAILNRRIIQNCGDDTASDTNSYTVSGTRSWSVTKTNGVTTTSGGSVSGSVGFAVGVNASVSLSFSQSINTSTSVMDGGSDGATRTSNQTVTVGPNRAVEVEFFAYQCTAEIPFSATVVVDGDLKPNQSGISQASSLLSETERTLPVTGVLRLADVSEGTLRTRNLGGSAGCGSPTGVEITNQSFPAFPASQLGSHFDAFAPLEALQKQNGQLMSHPGKFGALTWNVEDPPQTIGPPDGTHYEVLYIQQR